MATKEKGTQYLSHTIGRRKSSIARVYLKDGTGKIIINQRDVRDYFPLATNRYIVNQPVSLLKRNDRYDIFVNVKGGGMTGQAGAIRLGIARAVSRIDPDTRGELKKAGFLTRDSRKVERKKAGMKGARANFQFSKR